MGKSVDTSMKEKCQHGRETVNREEQEEHIPPEGGTAEKAPGDQF